ncbi:serine/arginine repetitive matrix protein 2-like [Drosophila kikkawai]|uniref:Serine/arginine repetitive matrix protein 2-like n=1 Tax=Drosophila kikkawai TaxID=30033 RepID=A0ABM4GG19_DROKI
MSSRDPRRPVTGTVDTDDDVEMQEALDNSIRDLLSDPLWEPDQLILEAEATGLSLDDVLDLCVAPGDPLGDGDVEPDGRFGSYRNPSPPRQRPPADVAAPTTASDATSETSSGTIPGSSGGSSRDALLPGSSGSSGDALLPSSGDSSGDVLLPSSGDSSAEVTLPSRSDRDAMLPSNREVARTTVEMPNPPPRYEDISSADETETTARSFATARSETRTRLSSATTEEIIEVSDSDDRSTPLWREVTPRPETPPPSYQELFGPGPYDSPRTMAKKHLPAATAPQPSHNTQRLSDVLLRDGPSTSSQAARARATAPQPSHNTQRPSDEQLRDGPSTSSQAARARATTPQPSHNNTRRLSGELLRDGPSTYSQAARARSIAPQPSHNNPRRSSDEQLRDGPSTSNQAARARATTPQPSHNNTRRLSDELLLDGPSTSSQAARARAAIHQWNHDNNRAPSSNTGFAQPQPAAKRRRRPNGNRARISRQRLEAGPQNREEIPCGAVREVEHTGRPNQRRRAARSTGSSSTDSSPEPTPRSGPVERLRPSMVVAPAQWRVETAGREIPVTLRTWIEGELGLPRNRDIRRQEKIDGRPYRVHLSRSGSVTVFSPTPK